MKAEINSDGFIEITAENITEAFAIKHITPNYGNESCEKCGVFKSTPILINCSILNNDVAESCDVLDNDAVKLLLDTIDKHDDHGLINVSFVKGAISKLIK